MDIKSLKNIKNDYTYVTSEQLDFDIDVILSQNFMGGMNGSFFKKAKWTKKFVIVPKRCAISNELLLFKDAWFGVQVIHGPAGEPPVYIKHWLSEEEYLLQVLKSGSS